MVSFISCLQRRFAFILIGFVLIAGTSVQLFSVDNVTEKIADTIEDKVLEPVAAAPAILSYSVAQTDAERNAALRILEPLAESGNLDAIKVVGDHYYIHDGSAEGKEKSFRFFMEGANQNDPVCLMMVGARFEVGEGVEVDQARAIEYYDKAMAAGSVEAYKLKGILLLNSGQFEEAISLLAKASESGLSEATEILGDVSHYGDFGEPDYGKAFAYYKVAAEQGSADAALKLGDYYKDGLAPHGIDLAAAFQAYDRSRELGNGLASGRLGAMYLLGEYVSFDLAIAVSYLRKGAAAGDRHSMIWLGTAYSHPDWEVRDEEECYFWSYIAAEMGSTYAKDFNDDLAAYLPSKTRLALQEKAAALIAELKGNGPL